MTTDAILIMTRIEKNIVDGLDDRGEGRMGGLDQGGLDQGDPDQGDVGRGVG